MLFAIPFPAVDPVLIEIGPLAIRWYALAYIAGIILGWVYIARLIKEAALWPGGAAPMSREDLDDFILWATLGIIIGGRLGYVLFYNPGYFLANPVEIPAVWQGGMAFHGGVVGLGVAMLIFARRRGIAPLTLMDLVCAAAPIGLFFGRIANFINAELWGRITEMPWGVIFPNAGPFPRHPSQLYEAALEGVVLFIVIRVLTHRYSAFDRPGLVLGTFLAGYGLARSFVEIYRVPDAHLGYLFGPVTMGMLLSLPMILAGAAIIFHALRRPPVQRAEARER